MENFVGQDASGQNFAPQKQTSGLAIAGLILSFLFAPLGAILSIIALVQIKNNPYLEGKGIAIAGFVLFMR